MQRTEAEQQQFSDVITKGLRDSEADKGQNQNKPV